MTIKYTYFMTIAAPITSNTAFRDTSIFKILKMKTNKINDNNNHINLQVSDYINNCVC